MRGGAASVALLEAGPEADVLDARIPAGFPKLYETERDWDYLTEPQPNAGDRQIEASREVILCAGAFGGPHLLMLSGIDDPAQLAVPCALTCTARHAWESPPLTLEASSTQQVANGLRLCRR